MGLCVPLSVIPNGPYKVLSRVDTETLLMLSRVCVPIDSPNET